jgi:hypothetical protein
MSKRAHKHAETVQLHSDLDHDENTIPTEPDSRIKQTRRNDNPLGARRERSTLQRLSQFALDMLLTIPPICFLAYAAIIVQYNGSPTYQRPVPALQSAAKYTPTIFPIVFAAIIGNLLKATAAWKLERGVTLLSLDYLMSSRTVFSAITAPFHVRAMNLLAPFLFGLWALSPLGGKAAFRVIQISTNTESEPWNINYLDVWSTPYRQTFTTLDVIGIEYVPSLLGAFNAALSSPAVIKNASQDLYGNIKIAMIESCAFLSTPDSDGWYGISETKNCSYSSLIGIPVEGVETNNYTFAMETSYMYTSCVMTRANTSRDGWIRYMQDPLNVFSNGVTLAIDAKDWSHHGSSTSPQELVLSSLLVQDSEEGWAYTVTNSTCALTTSYVEMDIFCHASECNTTRIRRSTQARTGSFRTVLDLPTDMEEVAIEPFLNSFVNSTNTPWSYLRSDSDGPPGSYYTPT